MSAELLQQTLTSIREAYLAFYRKVLTQLADEGVAYGVEVSVLVGGGDNPHQSRYNLPARVDVIRKTERGPQLLAVELDEPPQATALALQLDDGRETVLSPFHWNRCDVLFRGQAQTWAPALDWFEQWYDRDDRRPADALGLHGVIHAMEEPMETPHGQLVTVDFGSAPVAAAEGLLDTLHQMGLSEIRLGSFARPAADS